MAGRGPMQWDDTAYHGFSDQLPWKHGDTDAMNAADEAKDPDSVLNYYRALLGLKRQPLFAAGKFVMLPSDDQLFTYLVDNGQHQAAIVCNLTAKAQTYTLPVAAKQVLLGQGGATVAERTVTLPAWSNLVVKA